MKLGYQRALVSYCPDLTSPGAKSVPIAIMLVGEVAGERLAGIAYFLPNSLRMELDPISREILEDVPTILRRHVDEAASAAADRRAPLDTILRKLHHDLRNSLHVSEIGRVQEREINDENTGAVYSAIVIALTEALDELGVPTSARPPLPVPPRRKPDMSMWRVRGSLNDQPSISP